MNRAPLAMKQILSESKTIEELQELITQICWTGKTFTEFPTKQNFDESFEAYFWNFNEWLAKTKIKSPSAQFLNPQISFELLFHGANSRSQEIIKTHKLSTIGQIVKNLNMFPKEKRRPVTKKMAFFNKNQKKATEKQKINHSVCTRCQSQHPGSAKTCFRLKDKHGKPIETPISEEALKVKAELNKKSRDKRQDSQAYLFFSKNFTEKVRLGSNSCTAVLDTGADHNFLHPSLLPPNVKVKEESKEILTANGTFSINKSVMLPLTLNNISTKSKFLLLKHKQPKVILIGNQEMKKRGIKLNMTNPKVPLLEKPRDSGKVQNPNDKVHQQNQIEQLIMKNQKLFEEFINLKAQNSFGNHKILLNPVPKFKKCRPFQIVGQKQEEMKKIISKLLRQNIIKELPPQELPICLSPTILVKKNTGNFRMVHDFRDLNLNTISQTGPIPNINTHLAKISRGKIFSCIDLSDAYYQINLDPKSQRLTCFTGPENKIYYYKSMPQGIKNAAFALQRFVGETLKPFQTFTASYFDDITIFSSSFEEHVVHLRKVFERLTERNIRINQKKCQFAVTKLEILGFILEDGKILPKPAKIAILEEWLKDHPKGATSLKEKQSIIGLVSAVGNFIPNIHEVLDPLYSETSKEVFWTDSCSKAIRKAIKILKSEIRLSFPDCKLPFQIWVDSSRTGTGAVLTQRNSSGQYRLIDLFSKRQVSTKPATFLELNGIKAAFRKWRPFLSSGKFEIFTDHRPLCSRSYKDEKLLQSFAEMNHLEYEIRYIKGKDHILADYLSRLTTEENLLLTKKKKLSEAQRLDRELKQWKNKEKKLYLKKQKALLKNPISNNESQGKGTGKRDLELKSQSEETDLAKNELNTSTKEHKPVPKEIAISNAKNPTPLKDINLKLKLKKVETKMTKKREDYQPVDLNAELLAKYQKIDPYCQQFAINQLGIRHLNERWVIPDSIAETIIRDLHVLQGHPGFKILNQLVKERFVINQLSSLTQHVLDTCSICREFKTIHQKIGDSEEMFIRARKPFEIVCCDLAGPEKENNRKFWTLVLVDKYSKFCKLVNIEDLSDETMSQAVIQHWIQEFGPPESFWSDNATNFKGSFFTELNSLLNIKNFYSLPKNPKANGQAESAVKKFKNLYKIIRYNNPTSSISQITQWCQQIINSTPTVLLKMSPLEALTGVRPRTYFDLLSHQPQGSNDEPHPLILKKIRETIDRINEAQILKQNNKKISPHRLLKVGQLVTIRLPPDKKTPNPQSAETFKIQSISPEGASFTLETLSGSILDKTFQATQLQKVETNI